MWALTSKFKEVDEIDLKILKILRENSRISFTKLAKVLGISESSVRKRVNRLIRLGIIRKFTIEYRLDNEIKAAILVRTSPSEPVFKISNIILNMKCVDKVYEVTGDNDILVMVKGLSIDDINKCIDEIRAIEGVTSTNTMIILRTWSK